MISGSIEGVELTVSGLEALGTGKTRAGALVGIMDGIVIAYAASYKMISAGDHSLAELADMGHPYSAEHPAPPHAEPFIHVQGGAYRAALQASKPIALPDEILEGAVGIMGDEAMEQLDVWLQTGTLKMIARPWGEYVVQQFGDQILNAMEQGILRGMEESLREFG